MAKDAISEITLSRTAYETIKVQLYTEMQRLIEQCDVGHGDKQLLWNIRQARHDLLKSLSDRAGVPYPEMVEWLTDQERTVHGPRP